MKKYLILSLVAVMSLVSLAPALANENKENKGKSAEVRANVEVRKELKLEIKEERKDLKDKIKELAHALRFAPRAINLTGKLVSVNSTSTSSTEITVNLTKVSPNRPKNMPSSTVAFPQASTTITLKITGKTSLIKAWGGRMKVSDMAPGDQLHMVVKFNTDGSLDLRVLKDNSLHILSNKKGTVESIDVANSTFVLKQEKRALAVHTDSQTKFFMRNNTNTSFTSLQVGDKVAVEGTLNINLNTVIARSVTIKKQATSTVPSDLTPPVGNISINAGATTTVSSSVNLALSATDNASGVTQMRFSNDGVTFGAAIAYTTSAPWTLTSGNGLKTVYVQYRDGAGNWSSAIITDTITLEL